MRRLRFFCEHIDTRSTLDPIESNHLSRVMRVRVGETVELFDGKGTLAVGVVDHIGKKETVIQTHTIKSVPATSSGRIILSVSFAKNQRFDWLVEKCTELGVNQIVPVLFERTVKQGSLAGIKRYRKISIAAAKQSERLYVPEIRQPVSFTQTISTFNEQCCQSLLLYGDAGGTPVLDLTQTDPTKDMVIFIGPEGGFSNAETALLKANGAMGVSVNKNVLRIETAAVAFCAILSASRL